SIPLQAYLGKFQKALMEYLFAGSRNAALREFIPVESRSVTPPGIPFLTDIMPVARIINGSGFLTKIEKRYASNRERDAVEQKNTAERQFDFGFILIGHSLLQTAERRGGAADASIAT